MIIKMITISASSTSVRIIIIGKNQVLTVMQFMQPGIVIHHCITYYLNYQRSFMTEATLQFIF